MIRKRVVAPARQATSAGGIETLESILGLLKCLKIRALIVPRTGIWKGGKEERGEERDAGKAYIIICMLPLICTWREGVVRGTLPGADVRLPLSAGDASSPLPLLAMGG